MLDAGLICLSVFNMILNREYTKWHGELFDLTVFFGCHGQDSYDIYSREKYEGMPDTCLKIDSSGW